MRSAIATALGLVMVLTSAACSASNSGLVSADDTAATEAAGGAPTGATTTGAATTVGPTTAPARLPTSTLPSGDEPVVTWTPPRPTPSAPAPDPPSPSPSPAPPPPVPIPSDVLFDTGSSDLRPEAVDALRQFYDDLVLAYPGAGLRLVGHTDSRGGDTYNLQLSERRARAVQQAFDDFGHPPGLLSAAGAGESDPVVPDTGVDGRFDGVAGQRNRRVEVEITPPP